MNAPVGDALARQYTGAAPWEEAWFCEIALPGERGLWLRYTLHDGADPHVACWATWFDGDQVVVHRERQPLSRLDPEGVFRVDAWRLDSLGARGQAGSVAWDLRFTDRGRGHAHYPPLLQALGIPSRTYVPAIFDLQADGAVSVGDEAVEIQGARGVLGHLYGDSRSLRRWVWAHANTFEGNDAVCEVLGASLGRGPLRTPMFGSVALLVDGRTWRFSRLRDLVRTRFRLRDRSWTFRARRGEVVLEGEARLPGPDRVARLTYRDSGERRLYCSNSRLGRLHLDLRDPEAGIHHVLRTEQAAVEIGDRHRPPGPLHLD